MKKIPAFAIIAGVMVLTAIVMFVIALTAGEKTEQIQESKAPTAEQAEIARLEEENLSLTQQVEQLKSELEQYGVDMKQTMQREEAAVQAYSEMQAQLETAQTDAETYKAAAEAAMDERSAALEEKDKVVLLYEKLWRAMTYFDQERYDECKAVLDEMEYLEPEKYLSSTSDSSVILTPAAKYQQMLEYFN